MLSSQSFCSLSADACWFFNPTRICSESASPDESFLYIEVSHATFNENSLSDPIFEAHEYKVVITDSKGNQTIQESLPSGHFRDTSIKRSYVTQVPLDYSETETYIVNLVSDVANMPPLNYSFTASQVHSSSEKAPLLAIFSKDLSEDVRKKEHSLLGSPTGLVTIQSSTEKELLQQAVDSLALNLKVTDYFNIGNTAVIKSPTGVDVLEAIFKLENLDEFVDVYIDNKISLL